MTRGAAGALVAMALAGSLALRIARLDVRPMHHDEANQALKFADLLERGEYRYDTHDHHGPTLYFLTVPAAVLRGQRTLASLDERTLRGVTAAFGAATILLLPLAAPGIGRTAAVAAACLMALSPAMVFYSRMYIQEPLFVCFSLAFLVAAGRAATGGAAGWWVAAGAAAGFAGATKETSAIVLPAALAALALARWSVGRAAVGTEAWPPGGARWSRLALAVLSGVLVAAIFYSSFLADPSGLLGPVRAAGTYIDRGLAPASHVQPWHYYLGLLTFHSSGGLRWSEGAVLLLALAGLVAAVRPQRAALPAATFWIRYIALYTVLAAAAFSLVRYKTPWNLLPFYAGAIVLAGIGFAGLLRRAGGGAARAALTAACGLAALHLGWQAWRAAITYASDPRNPYAYAQTVPDAVRMAARIRALAALHPDGTAMPVSVIAGPYEQWPLPWYLRGMPHVGYWTTAADGLTMQAPVVVASIDHTDALDEALGDGYISEFFGLRPEVLLTLYIERGLWDRFLREISAHAAGVPCPSGRPGAQPPCGGAVSVRR